MGGECHGWSRLTNLQWGGVCAKTAELSQKSSGLSNQMVAALWIKCQAKGDGQRRKSWSVVQPAIRERDVDYLEVSFPPSALSLSSLWCTSVAPLPTALPRFYLPALVFSPSISHLFA